MGTLLYFPGHRPVLVGGLLRYLPVDHFVRTALKPDEYYQADPGPTLVLGPANYGDERQPRAFYSLKSAILLTKQLRKEQADREWDKQRAIDEAERREAAARLRTPEGAIRQLQEQVAALRGEKYEHYTAAELEADPMLRQARALEQFAEAERSHEQRLAREKAERGQGRTRTQQMVAEAVAKAAAVPVAAENEPPGEPGEPSH
jgi:hypothetical protein